MLLVVYFVVAALVWGVGSICNRGGRGCIFCSLLSLAGGLLWYCDMFVSLDEGVVFVVEAVCVPARRRE